MPDFEVVDQDGNKVCSKDLIGKKTIVYFYPKDNTSGCTAEACNLRDNHEALIAKGYNVIGVSKDSAASHRRFKDKYDLPFTLLSDTSTEMLQAFGADLSWESFLTCPQNFCSIMKMKLNFLRRPTMLAFPVESN